ncbi:MAG: hypothetical protein KKF44_08390 [Nanoarchaeota archaeon]|nr:hypothetical protein [Nanoarchaeota archaeon]
MQKKTKIKEIKYLTNQISLLKALLKYFSDKKNFYENIDITNILADIVNKGRALYMESETDSDLELHLYNGFHPIQEIQEAFIINQALPLEPAIRACESASESLGEAMDILEPEKKKDTEKQEAEEKL